ncbi:MAG TPA: porin, partial [Thermoanaerobaculia bacterium]|nr:porin [Thermoanaerobaculia bacterium]
MRRSLRPSTRLALAVAAVAVTAATPAAQAQDDWDVTWSNGFKVENKEKGFALKFGGRLMADYTFADADETLGALEDGFELRRARLFFSGTVYERIEFKAQYDFAGGAAAAKDLYVGLLFDPATLRFGHYKEYFSLEELTSSKYITFLERSLPVEAFAPSRNSGVGVHGATGETLNWGVGAFYDADDFGESVSEDDYNVTGRIGWRPIYQDDGDTLLHLGFGASLRERGGSMRFRARPEAHLAPRFVDTGNFAGDGATVLGGEVAGVFGPFWFASEYMQAATDAPTVGDPTFGGYYVQAGWFLTGESRAFDAAEGAFARNKPAANFGKGGGAWEIALRYSHLDLTDAGVRGGEQDDFTVG